MSTRTSHYRPAVDLMRELDDRQGLVSSLVTLSQLGGTYDDATLVTADGTPDEWLGYGEEGLAIARASGLRSGEAYALALLSCAARAYGRYGTALDYGRQALDLTREIAHLQWSIAAHSGLAQLHLGLLDPASALEHGSQALTL